MPTITFSVQTLAAGLVFCRVGACLMLAPGFSSAQVPPQIRLFVAIGVSLALAGIVPNAAAAASSADNPVALFHSIVTESLVGGSIGMIARLFVLALETTAYASATLVGFSNPFGIDIEPNQSMPPFATLITVGATATIFFADLHWAMLEGLSESFKIVPLGGDFSPAFALRGIASTLRESFMLALRVCSPFILYSIIVNVAASLLNRLAPQIGVYATSAPFMIAGGAILLYATIAGMMTEFSQGLATWLARGWE